MATLSAIEKKNIRSREATEQMRALVFRGPNQIAIEKVPVPKPGYGQVVIRVTLTTICGTDVHILPNARSWRGPSHRGARYFGDL